MFLNTLAVTLVKMKKMKPTVEKRRETGNNMCPSDGRGIHRKQVELSLEGKQCSRLNLFQMCKSHYSKKKKKKIVYLHQTR